MRLLPVLALLLPPAQPAAETRFDPAARAAALAPLIEDETYALVRLDATRIDLEGLLKTLGPVLAGHNDVEDLVKSARELLAAFTRAGGNELAVAFSTEDLPRFSLVQVPVKEGADIATLTRLLKHLLGSDVTVQKRGGSLLAGTPAALARHARGKPSVRAELAAPVQAAGDTAVQALLLPTADQRRVIEEAVRLPAVGASGTTLTQGVRWAALGLDVGATPELRLTLTGASPDAAQQMARLISASVDQLGKRTFPGEEKPLRDLLPREFTAVARVLKPAVAGERVTLQVRDPAGLGALAALARGVEERGNGVERSATGYNLKAILIAIYNYHDVTGTFPPHAIYSKAGKPLLSWRVAILPYIEEQALYNQFKLDEPWDSPNNKPLLEKMPKLYRSPKIKDPRPGLTTYLAAINKDFIFTGTDKGLKIADIPDGTSNTGMLVDVADEAGVPWSKPDDLVVSPKEPWKGLLGHYPGFILVGMADGSVKRVVKTVPAETLWALFTRNGGEILPDLSR
jgi:hypothetical protein